MSVAVARKLFLDLRDQPAICKIAQSPAPAPPSISFFFTELWLPGSGRLSEPASKVRAVLMIASLTGFQSGRRVIARAAGHADPVDEVIAALYEQIDAFTSN
jgi:hypothetical protein